MRALKIISGAFVAVGVILFLGATTNITGAVVGASENQPIIQIGLGFLFILTAGVLFVLNNNSFEHK